MYLKPLKFSDTNPEQKSFLSVLRKRVDNYFRENHISKKANSQMIFKSIVFISLYIIPFVIYIVSNPNLFWSLSLWGIMAIGISGIGMCIMHDANHSAYFQSHNLNHYLGKIINIVGGSAFNWKIQHNVLHHTYTNVSGYDDDIDDKSILKLSPHGPSKGVHRFQHIYAFLFYSIATLYWCTVKDFIQLIRYTKEGLNKNSKSENLMLWINLMVSKISYFAIILFSPTVLFQISISKTLICFLFMHAIGGIILTTVFQLAHTVEGTSHPLPDEKFIIENNWAIHQMETTVNFSRDNKWISWFVGGLNFQIEHHLFPNICHVHYPKISHIVEQTAAEYKIPYLEHKSLGDALSSHIRALKNFSKP